MDYMGGPGKAVITLSVSGLKKSGAAYLIPSDEISARIDRLSFELAPSSSDYPLPLSEWDITGTANGLVSSTEVGTLLIWDPGFTRSSGSMKYYTNKSIGMSAGVPMDGIVLFTSGEYQEAYSSLFEKKERFIPEEKLMMMKNALASLYLSSPKTLPPLGFDIPRETVDKIASIFLVADDGDGCFLISGEIEMINEDSARTLCTLFRNLLVQAIRKSGERLDVKALSGIFTYDGSVLRISDYKLSYSDVGNLLTKES